MGKRFEDTLLKKHTSGKYTHERCSEKPVEWMDGWMNEWGGLSGGFSYLINSLRLILMIILVTRASENYSSTKTHTKAI